MVWAAEGAREALAVALAGFVALIAIFVLL
jgi:hypothetical protein